MPTAPLGFKLSLLKLVRVFLPEKNDFFAACLFALLAGLVQLSLPLGIQSIINFVLAGTISTSIIVLIIMVVLGVFLNGLLQVRQLQIIEKVKQKIFVRYSLEYSDRLPKLDIERLDNVYLPEAVNRFFDIVSLQKSLDKLMIELPAAIIQVTLGVILLSLYHPLFIAFGIVLIGIVFIIISITSPKGLQAASKASTFKYAVAAWIEDIARMIKTFKYTRGSSLHIHRTDDLVTQYLVSRTRYFKILLTQFWSLISFKIIITAAMLVIGAYLLVDQQINIGQFIAADIVIIAIIFSIEKLILNLEAVYDAIVAVEKLGLVAEADTERNGTLLFSDHQQGPSIEFKDVSFSYAGHAPVLNNLSFSITNGERVLIKGPSGSGKSTILRLLTGAFQQFQGAIYLDKLPVANYEIQSLRKQTGILLGKQDIFQGTLLENLTMGNTSIDFNQLNKLCALTGLEEFIGSTRQGYDTYLLPVGSQLSNRVRKNILLVRALLADYRLLLLEEPFEHLTPPFKKRTMDYIFSKENSTILIASNDDEIINYCQQVIELTNSGHAIVHQVNQSK